MSPARFRQMSLGARDSLPVIIGSMPFGVIFGALAISAGLSTWATMGMSLFVFAGSAQFVAAGLVAQQAALWVIIFTTLIVNLRHALYAASLGPYLAGRSQRWLLGLGFWLTDETYAVVIQRYASDSDHEQTVWYHLGSCLAMYFNWQICTLIGIVAGTRLQGLADWGLEFAMVVTFIGIVVPMLKAWPQIVCALIAGAVALLCRDWPHQSGLLFGALAGIGAGMFVGRLSAFKY